MNDRLEERLRSAAAGIRPAELDPGAFARRALEEGVADVAYATVDTPIGPLLLAGTERGLVRVAFCDREHDDEVLEKLAARVSPRVIEAPARLDDARRQLDDYFEGRLREFELALDWSLVGPFGRRVLGRTARIPYGQVSSYGEVARDIGSPRAARATGNALGSNPIPIVVPCHRVLRGTGHLGGYGGGIERKERLLELERRGVQGSLFG